MAAVTICSNFGAPQNKVWYCFHCFPIYLLSDGTRCHDLCLFILYYVILFNKVDLKLNIQKTKIMASGPITSWETDGETVETVADFIFGAPKLLQMVIAAIKLKDAYSLEGKLWPI